MSAFDRTLDVAKDMAIACSKRSTHDTFFHGSVIMIGGKVVATGFNTQREHAEWRALRKLPSSWRKKLIVWSVRTTKTGKLSAAKPCNKCLPFLKENGVEEVYYTNSDGSVGMIRL